MAWMAFPLMGLGCLEAETRYEVEISGTVESTETGPVELWFLYESWGEDDLETTDMVIDTLWLDSGMEFSTVVVVDLEKGCGLSVYGWQDVDEDGAHCRPGTEPEPSGWVGVEDFPSNIVEISLALDIPCEGPEGL